MTTATLPDHLHAFNFHTGRPRFHFDEPPPSPPPPPPSPPPAKPWYDGVDAEMLGHWQNKGWKIDDPKEIALAATKQTREAERHFGVPLDRLLKLPGADAKPEEWTALYQRLGAPAKPEEYDFSTVKNAAGEVIPQPLADVLRATAHAKGLNKDAATDVAKAVVKHMDDAKAAETVVANGKIAEQMALLEKNWGPKDSATYKLNHLQAMEGARKAGITADAVKSMEKEAGYASVMDHFRRVGSGMSEDSFHQGGGPGGAPTTREGAVARLAELEGDKAWGKRLTAGDVVAKAEWTALTALIGNEAA